jgi:multimeric flavodoxin WrbA
MDKVKVKILGVSFAHRKGQNTAWLVQFALKAAEKFGRKISPVADIETEFVDLGDKKITPCLGCTELPCVPLPYEGDKIVRKGCRIKNDFLATELKPKIGEADGFVFGAPVFTGTYTSKFKVAFERITGYTWDGYINDSGKRGYSFLNNKPAGCVTVATWSGQDLTLQDMNRLLQGTDMLPIAWLQGGRAVSGPPFGPFPYEDKGDEIAVKKDRLGQWTTLMTGRRVAEIAVMMALARRDLGEIYDREFMQWFHPPHGDESWAWKRLDPADAKFMDEMKPPAKTTIQVVP